MKKAFDCLKSPDLKLYLGCILKIGNFLNAGKDKGQADGFYLDGHEKTKSYKSDKTKGEQTIIYLACKYMYISNNPSFVAFKSNFNPLYAKAKLFSVKQTNE